MPQPAPVPPKLIETVLFPRPSPSYTIHSFPGELIWIPKQLAYYAGAVGQEPPPEGVQTVPCLLQACESAQFLILYFHSNAEDLGMCRWFCKFLHEQFQVHVLAVEYPGYGVSPGSPTPGGICTHAHAALQFATKVLRLPLSRIKIFGRSIGTGPALELAAKFAVSGLILVTPFLSVRELIRDRLGPLANFFGEWFENIKAIPKVTASTLIIHGKKDTLIPCRHGETIYAACKARKAFVSPAEMEHNTNLATDLSFLLLPMYHLFSLPEYCFDPFEVPAWAYDKRRSPLYEPKEGDEDEDSAGVNQAGRETSRPEPKPSRDTLPAGIKHQTVRHNYQPTKEKYDFTGSGRIGFTSKITTSLIIKQPVKHDPGVADSETTSTDVGDRAQDGDV